MFERKQAYEKEVVTNRSSVSSFVKQTYQLFALSLLSATLGAYIGLGIVPMVTTWFWGLVILEFVFLISLYFVKNKQGLNYLMFFLFTFVSGLTLTPLLAHFIGHGNGNIVINALALTTVAFGGLSVFAMNTKKDFSTMGKMLMITLIVVIVASILNLFIHSSIFQLVIASISSILFSFFILYDTQNIIRGEYETPIEGAIALYLDFLNLFVNLLQILGIIDINKD